MLGKRWGLIRQFDQLVDWELFRRFNQPFGAFSGTLRDQAGNLHVLGDVFGVTEEHYARW